jgi:enoyl-CoA hydratase/3-hydroxyacyl-CoA dehydrogenase
MPQHYHLRDDSPWSVLRERFDGIEGGFVVCDRDGADGPCLLLHRAAENQDEIGFFLEDARSTLVEVSAAPSAPRELVARAWKFARDCGLTPVRLGAGQPSVLGRMQPLRDDPIRLAVFLGRLIEERAIGTEDLDLLLAHRWPDRPHPFAALNALDAGEREALLEEARVESGRAHLPSPLRRDLQAGRRLAERRVEWYVDRDVAHVRIVRPQALNALDPEMLDELVEAWEQSAESARAIVLESEGPAFMAGVDLDLILRWMEADRLDRIEDFVSRAQRFLALVDASPQHTLARVDGFAVGAGAEFCCAFDTVIASTASRIGFPELGLGIYPAMGGTQRLPRRIGYHRARAWILGAGVWSAQRAREFGFADAVVDIDTLDAEVARRAAGEPSRPRAARIEPAPDGPGGARPAGRPWLTEPTVASRIASDLLDLSRTASLADGTAAELEHLAEVYRTAEAMTGLRFARRSRRP